jgi:hypothetical protein
MFRDPVFLMVRSMVRTPLRTACEPSIFSCLRTTANHPRTACEPLRTNLRTMTANHVCVCVYRHTQRFAVARSVLIEGQVDTSGRHPPRSRREATTPSRTKEPPHEQSTTSPVFADVHGIAPLPVLPRAIGVSADDRQRPFRPRAQWRAGMLPAGRWTERDRRRSWLGLDREQPDRTPDDRPGRWRRCSYNQRVWFRPYTARRVDRCVGRQQGNARRAIWAARRGDGALTSHPTPRDTYHLGGISVTSRDGSANRHGQTRATPRFSLWGVKSARDFSRGGAEMTGDRPRHDPAARADQVKR